MPIESNEAEDNEEREGDFYSHAHTWSFLLVQPIVAWKALANKRHLEPTLRFELRDPQFNPADGPLEDFTNRQLMQLFSPEMKRLKGWLGAGGRAIEPGASAVAGVTFCTREFHVVPSRQMP